MSARPCAMCSSSRLRTPGQHRVAPLNGTALFCLRPFARLFAPINTHVNGGGSVQLGSIRNPDLVA
jgi:hypothetical protein